MAVTKCLIGWSITQAWQRAFKRDGPVGGAPRSSEAFCPLLESVTRNVLFQKALHALKRSDMAV